MTWQANLGLMCFVYSNVIIICHNLIKHHLVDDDGVGRKGADPQLVVFHGRAGSDHGRRGVFAAETAGPSAVVLDRRDAAAADARQEVRFQL